MMYIWWVVSVLLLCAWAISHALPIPLGQRRVQAIVRFIQTVIAMSVAVLFVLRYSWVGGAIAVAALVAVMVIGRMSFVHAIARSLYTLIVPKAMPWIARQQWLDYVSERTSIGKKMALESYDELESVINNAPFLRPAEAHMLLTTISSRDVTALDCMTPLESIATVSSTDVIGPLLLDELHHTKQTDFAVVDDQKIIGTVQLDSLIEMSHVSSSIKEVMQHNVLRVGPTTRLKELVDMMISQHAWLCVVHDGRDIGTISLSQITSSLLGKPPK